MNVCVGAALAVLVVPVRASAQDLEARIDAFVSAGDPASAAPLALEAAQRDPDRLEAWERARTIAGWSSNAEIAITALQNLVRLRPEARDLRFALSQQLLWAERTNAALPHAEWLLDHDEADPAALEVVSWIFLGEGRRGRARDALRRWIAALPDTAGPRWILADATHWSVRWREARAQYEALTDDEEYAERAAERQRMLRRDHATRVEAGVVHWDDNTGVSFLSIGARAQIQLPERLVLTSMVERGRWQQSRGTVTGNLGTIRAGVGLRVEASDPIQPEVVVGTEFDSESNRAPFVIARAHISLFGKIFGRVEAGWDRYRLSLAAAREDIRVAYGRVVAYAEPHPWLFLGVDASLSRLSDDNARYYGVAALGAHNPHAFQIEPRVFVQLEEWAESRENAFPYFTNPDLVAFGGDLTLRYKLDHRFRAEAGIGVILQGDRMALVPKALLQLDLWEHLICKVTVGYVGAVTYRQTRVDGWLGYRF
ncbi:MAG: hypothetical protein AAGE52_21050 [Myxococcota bacterium]